MSLKKYKPSLRKKSLKISTIEGSWWSVMFGAGESYLGAYFEFLKFTSFQISVISTLPSLAGSIIQSLTGTLFHVLKSRKKLLIFFKVIQGIIWLCFIFSIFYTKDFKILLIFASIYYIAALSMMAPWNSWMGYLVPSKIRGRYFGNRSQIVRIFMLLSSVIAGLILHIFSSGDTSRGFLVIFSIAFIANIGSIFFLTKKYEPPYAAITEHNTKVNLKNKNYKKIRSFILFDSMSEFSISILAPLVVLYWLRDLNFNYLDLTLVTTISQLVALFSMRYWGIILDKYGTMSTIHLSSFILIFLPFLWYLIYFFPSILILPSTIFIASVSALIFGGRALAMDNRLFELMKGENIINISAKRFYYRGISLFLGGLVGGYLSTINLNAFKIVFPLPSLLHPVMFAAIFIRTLVWIYLFFVGKKTF